MHSVVYDICDSVMNIDVLWYRLKVMPFKCVTGVMGPEQRRINVHRHPLNLNFQYCVKYLHDRVSDVHNR